MLKHKNKWTVFSNITQSANTTTKLVELLVAVEIRHTSKLKDAYLVKEKHREKKYKRQA